MYHYFHGVSLDEDRSLNSRESVHLAFSMQNGPATQLHSDLHIDPGSCLERHPARWKAKSNGRNL